MPGKTKPILPTPNTTILQNLAPSFSLVAPVESHVGRRDSTSRYYELLLFEQWLRSRRLESWSLFHLNWMELGHPKCRSTGAILTRFGFFRKRIDLEGGDNASSEQCGPPPVCVSSLFLGVQSPISMLIPGFPRSGPIVAGRNFCEQRSSRLNPAEASRIVTEN